MKFKIGDLVTISEKGKNRWGQDSSQLQEGQEGRIVGRNGGSSLVWNVHWGNQLNSYYESDLKLIKAKEGDKKMSNKFKVGDKVRIKQDDPTDGSSIQEAWKEKNSILTIEEIEENDGNELLSCVDENGRTGGIDPIRVELATKKRTRKKKVEKKVPLIETVVIDKTKKEQILEAISQKENANKIFDDWGFSEVFEKGTAVSLLFYGIPGTGKTLMAQAIAEQLGMKFNLIDAAEIQTSEPGGAERKIKAIFKEAGKDSVILLDECDSLLMDRNQVGHIMASQINTLLSEIERFEGVVIFTTNRLGRLDPALERRISGKIEFEFPDKQAREKIWLRMIPKKAPIAKDVDFKKIANYPLTGGSIKNCVLNAARKAAHKKLKSINHSCFIESIEKEMRSIAEFAANREKSWTQGGFVASRDLDIVQGDHGLAVEKVNNFFSGFTKETKQDLTFVERIKEKFSHAIKRS